MGKDFPNWKYKECVEAADALIKQRGVNHKDFDIRHKTFREVAFREIPNLLDNRELDSWARLYSLRFQWNKKDQ